MKKSPLNHCSSDMMHSEAWNSMRKRSYVGKKSALNMLGISPKSSPLNDMTELENDSIAATNAWSNMKSAYTNREFKGNDERLGPITPEQNEAEYNAEKNEFYFDTDSKKLKLIPTDDGEVQDEDFKSKLKSWQLAPRNL